jgi:glycosyltransferase involved in cell wall biosynthesis
MKPASVGRVQLAILVPTLAGGGAESVVVILANEMAARGITLEILTFSETGRLRPRLTEGIPVRQLGGGGASTALSPLIRYIRRSSPATLLVTLSHALVTAAAARYLVGTTPKVVGRVSTHMTTNVDERRGMSRWAAGAALRFGLHAMDHVIAGSEGVAEDLRTAWRLPGERLSVIPNPVDAERLTARSAQPPRHPWFRQGRAFRTIVSVGRLEWVKGQDLLIRALPALRRRHEARIVLIGDGPARAGLEDLAVRLGVGEWVHFAGYVPEPYAFVRHADLFASASRREGMPNALIEALVLAQRIVATDCKSGPREILQDGSLGRLVPVEDSPALARGIADALDEPGWARGVEGWSRFAKDAVVDRYLGVLEG